MSSPFVRFSRFVRSPLSLATIGLGTLWGCRQLPSSHRTIEYAQPTYAPSAPLVGSYEESALASDAGASATQSPIVSLSEGDVSVPLPSEPVEPPMPTVKSAESSLEIPETAVVPRPDRKLPTVVKPPERPEVAPKLGVPPEPAPKKELDLETESEPEAKSETKPKTELKELALVDDTKTDEQLEALKPQREVAATLEHELLSLNSYCDGLVFDSQGFGYVSHKNQIVRFSPTGESMVWATLNSPKGHRIEPEGTHLVCDVERRAVLRLSFDGKVVGVAASECEGVPFRAPFDIAVDPQGGFYFTDPGYVQIKNPTGKLHYVDRAGHVSVVAAKIGYPTGVVYDSERQRVLVAESQFNRILEFRLSQPGRMESHEILAQLPKSSETDYHLASLCLDAVGNLFVTQQQTKAVHLFDLQGRASGRFSTGSVIPSSVALRSPDSDELIFTGEVDARPRHGKVMRVNLGK